jgi:gas vesicle protein
MYNTKIITMSKTTNLLLGVLGAAAAGVVVGLLIAPDKGSETRKKISKKTNDWKDHVNSLIKSGKEYLNDVSETIAEEGEGLKSDAEKRYNRVKEEATA